MGRRPGKPNTVCATCGDMFHKAPSLKHIRCPKCRKGKQGKGVKYG